MLYFLGCIIEVGLIITFHTYLIYTLFVQKYKSFNEIIDDTLVYYDYLMYDLLNEKIIILNGQRLCSSRCTLTISPLSVNTVKATDM